jgi:hypothetical protein
VVHCRKVRDFGQTRQVKVEREGGKGHGHHRWDRLEMKGRDGVDHAGHGGRGARRVRQERWAEQVLAEHVGQSRRDREGMKGGTM